MFKKIHVTFRWGNQSSRGQVHLALAEICALRVLSARPRRRLCDQWSLSVNHSGCLAMSRITAKVIGWFQRKVMLTYDWAYQSEEVINFWCWYGPGYGFRITFSTSLNIAELGILDLLAFLIQSPAAFHDAWRNDWRQQGNISKTFLGTIWQTPADPNLD